ncbi:MAG TPA: AcvB/VirJ family lysyl-phosphatidylglycerol hydrolase [Steroidobacteraceae bacterium]|jgi:type IV secretory pathway VirJ component|nr:AcvB/VirJ family lysyl-phosphatidylglycerol hydrolase [Steroidobacteraceae bacterium]
MKSLVLFAALALFGAMAAAAPAHLSHGRFKDLAVYSPPAQATSFVLFLSGDEGWSRSAEVLAEQLAQQGAMVVGIDLPKFEAVLEADGGDCVFPDGDLENLSHFVQAYFHNSSYLAPLLVGVGAGGSMAYAVLAQGPQDTFAGALSVGFCPHLNFDKPLCKGSGLELTHGARGSGLSLLPIKSLNNPWVVLQDSKNRACPPEVTRDFVAHVHGAAVATLPGFSERPLNAAFAKLAAANPKRAVAPPAELGDLPVVEVPVQPDAPPADVFAIIMSGDGGWAGIDQNIAAALSAKGVRVVGLDSLRYYWTARTPDGVAADTDRMIRYYLSHFGKKRVLLIGYSQGADVLPFAVNRLPAATKAAVSLVAILGMSEHALFEFHVSSWIADDKSGPATLPEVNRITGMPVLCIYGQDERDSLCPKLDPAKFNVVKVKGGHHFDGNYAGLADDILAAAKPSSR